MGKQRKLTQFRSGPVVADLRYFDAAVPDLGGLSCEFDAGSGTSLVKQALVMVEGSHTDSKKNHHQFDARRVVKLVNNTNQFLARGGRVPWQMDHKKDQASNIGDLEGPLEARVITEEDLPDPRLRDLVGKMGAFASELVAKGREVVQQVIDGSIKTLSPGIDITRDVIAEISATPTPAIVGLSTFRRAEMTAMGELSEASFALTFDEAERGTQSSKFREEVYNLQSTFMNVLDSISNADQDDLGGQSIQDFQMQAVEDYMTRLVRLLGLDGTGEAEEADPNQVMPPGTTPPGVLPNDSPMPDYLQNQQGVPPMARMNRPVPLAAFTMDDMENLIRRRGRANFAETSVPRRKRGKDKKKRKNRAGLIAGGVVGAGAIGTAGYRYGGSQFVEGVKLNRKVGLQTPIRTAARTAGVLGREQLGSDLRVAREAGGRAARYVGTQADRIPGSGKVREAAGYAGNQARRAAGYVSEKTAGARGYVSQQAGRAAGAVSGLPRAGKIGLGIAGAAAVGGAGYAGYRALTGRKKRRS